MRRSLLDFIGCPQCKGDLDLKVDEGRGEIVLQGRLTCSSCKRDFPIWGGVPRMNVKMEQLARIAKSFSYEWKAHHEGRFEDSTLFGRTLDEDWEFVRYCFNAEPIEFRDAAILDAGCGSAR